MRKPTLWIRTSTFFLVGMSTLASHAHAQADNAACQAIRKACRQAGFQPGQGLMRDCYRPIIEGNSGNGKALPAVDPEIVAECRASSAASAAPARSNLGEPPTI